MSSRIPRPERAIILLLTLLVLGTLLFFTVLLLGAHRGMRDTTRQACDQLVAGTAADSGLDEAIYRLREDPSLQVGFSEQQPSSGALYSVSLVSNVKGTAPLTLADGRVLPLQAAWLVSEGRYGQSVQRRECLVQIKGGSNPKILSRW